MYECMYVCMCMNESKYIDMFVRTYMYIMGVCIDII
jgi:hypothetical protein